MQDLAWILGGGLLMSAIAMIGGVTAVLRRDVVERILSPLVALAAGSLLGSAFFHMLPKGLDELVPLTASVWLVAGFATFLVLEQLVHWHHHRAAGAGGGTAGRPQPVTYLVLIGDGLHNFLGGIGIASTFLIDPRAGMVAFTAAAAHELPQELGDFGILVRGGWRRGTALLLNLLSALAFPLGAVLAWLLAGRISVAGLMLFAAGNFLYIAAADLVPEIKGHERLPRALAMSGCFALGLAVTLAIAALKS